MITENLKEEVPIFTVHCIQCGVKFETPQFNRKTCSRECSDKRSRARYKARYKLDAELRRKQNERVKVWQKKNPEKVREIVKAYKKRHNYRYIPIKEGGDGTGKLQSKTGRIPKTK